MQEVLVFLLVVLVLGGVVILTRGQFRIREIKIKEPVTLVKWCRYSTVERVLQFSDGSAYVGGVSIWRDVATCRRMPQDIEHWLSEVDAQIKYGRFSLLELEADERERFLKELRLEP
jgi:hypothetical protein